MIFIKNFQLIFIFLSQQEIDQIYNTLYEQVELLKQNIIYIETNIDYQQDLN